MLFKRKVLKMLKKQLKNMKNGRFIKVINFFRVATVLGVRKIREQSGK